MKQSTRRHKNRWHSTGWWANTPLQHFDSLLSFASQEIQESNWEIALWEAMGGERLCWITTSEGHIQTYLSEIDGFTQMTPHLPRILGHAATCDGTRTLQTKVKQVLNALVKIAHEVHGQRNGQAPTDWTERTKQRDLGFKLTGRGPDYSELPWDATHFDEREEILDTIRREFDASDLRTASVHSISGFIEFDNAGKDAPITLAWMLMGLVEVVFREEQPVLKRCLFCEKYFIHKTLKEKKFCSDPCRFNFHNKGLGRGAF